MRRAHRTLAALTVAVVLTACGAGDEDRVATDDEVELPDTDPEPAPDDAPTDALDAPDEPDEPDEPTGEAGDTDLDARVRNAIDDLAADEGVEPSAIEVEVAEATTWPDGSLGCPEPDGMYTQALVDGYRIVLRVDGREVAYHGAVGADPFRCDRPTGSTDPDG